MNIKEYLAIGACNGLKMYYEPLNSREKLSWELSFEKIELALSLKNKPICFSLDQLTKPIQIKDHNGGEPFVPMEVISKRLFGMEYKNAEFSITKTHIQIDFPNTGGWKYFPINNSEPWEFWIVEQLIKWHFAVGLSDDEFIPVTDEFNPYK